MTNRVFTYNSSRNNVNGDYNYNIGTLCVGVDYHDYYNQHNLSWWGGPDEELGYCIGTSVPGGNQPTPIGDTGTVQFWRTENKTDEGFLGLVKSVTGQLFTNVATACAYLDSNSYWTSFDHVDTYYFLISNKHTRVRYRTPEGDNVYRVMADSTPAYNLYQKESRHKNPVASYTLLTYDGIGSPSKITNGGCCSSKHQYPFKKGYFFTDVNVYKSNGVTAFGFPNGVDSYNTDVYQEIVAPWVP
jgi:hypothetical protein